MSEQPHHSDIPHLLDWANAMAFVASHYRQSYSPGDAACGGGVGDAENTA
ncbi:Putative type I secretion protein, ATP-binding protein (plasmid) [Klebsiella aerogenes]|nr:Putative type I secretion protein, ATP-binding protein [Klebsiella aerogenes]